MAVDDTIPQLPPDAENELVAELAQLVLQQAAPEELVIFEETAAEYFNNPRAVLDPGHRDEAVGFGLDMALLTPYILAVVTPVIRFLASTVIDAAREEAKPLVVRSVRRLFRTHQTRDSSDPMLAPLTDDQARSVHEIAYQRARDLGLADSQAVLLADAVVGGMVVAS